MGVFRRGRRRSDGPHRAMSMRKVRAASIFRGAGLCLPQQDPCPMPRISPPADVLEDGQVVFLRPPIRLGHPGIGLLLRRKRSPRDRRSSRIRPVMFGPALLRSAARAAPRRQGQKQSVAPTRFPPPRRVAGTLGCSQTVLDDSSGRVEAVHHASRRAGVQRGQLPRR